MINTPINIVAITNKPNAPARVAFECVDHQEYSLIKMVLVIERMKMKEQGTVQWCWLHRHRLSSDKITTRFF
jgi:hypothetical protein